MPTCLAKSPWLRCFLPKVLPKLIGLEGDPEGVPRGGHAASPFSEGLADAREPSQMSRAASRSQSSRWNDRAWRAWWWWTMMRARMRSPSIRCASSSRVSCRGAGAPWFTMSPGIGSSILSACGGGGAEDSHRPPFVFGLGPNAIQQPGGRRFPEQDFAARLPTASSSPCPCATPLPPRRERGHLARLLRPGWGHTRPQHSPAGRAVQCLLEVELTDANW